MRDGADRWMGLGSVDDVSLAEARDARDEARRMLRAGADPIDLRRAERMAAKAEKARGVAFRQGAQDYIKAHSPGWKNPKHRAQWTSTLETYAYPVIGDLSVADIDTALVLKVIEPIWTTKTETAARVRGRIELILDWATAREYRQGDNPARWKGHLDKLLPARAKVARVRHHAALPYGEIPVFMADLRSRKGVSPRALEFAILTATRTSRSLRETRGGSFLRNTWSVD